MVKDKIAILGASGFIVMHLFKKLADENFNILALIRNKNSKAGSELTKMGIQTIETGNLFEKKILNINLSRLKCLINLAALANVSSKSLKKKTLPSRFKYKIPSQKRCKTILIKVATREPLETACTASRFQRAGGQANVVPP